MCFTGQTHLDGNVIPREEAERMARQAGLVILPHVTKDLDIPVVADPDTLSGKAKKARDYGIRITADTAFWQKLGIGQRRAGAASAANGM